VSHTNQATILNCNITKHSLIFGRPFVKRFALCYRTVVMSVCLSVLSETLAYCGQKVGWIKMKIGMWVGLGPGHIVLDGDPALLPPKGHSPRFLAHICCGQMAGWIKMPLGMEVGLGPNKWGHSSLLPKKGAEPPSRSFGPCPLWLNGCMDQYGTWHGGGPWSRPHYARWVFSSCLLRPSGWMHQDATWCGGRP